ncbi:MAG TPA: hypothetical protein VGD61_07810 [Pyrinomonadaceae bacterium]
MQQITRSIYIVNQGENVTVEIEATKVGNFAVLSIDGQMKNPVAGVVPLTWRFPVTVGPGFDHFGMVSCHFPPTAPNDAVFQIFVSGSGGGARFTGSDIKKIDPSKSRSLEFRCV